MSFKDPELYAITISAIALGTLFGTTLSSDNNLMISDVADVITSIAALGTLVTAVFAMYSWQKSILYQRKLKALDELSKAFSTLALSIGNTRLCLEDHSIFFCYTDPTRPYKQFSLSSFDKKEVRHIFIDQAEKRDLYESAYEVFIAIWGVELKPILNGGWLIGAEQLLEKDNPSRSIKDWEELYTIYRDNAHETINFYYKELSNSSAQN